MNNVANNIKQSSVNIYSEQLQAINNLTVYLENNSQNLPNITLEISKDNLNKMNSGMGLFYTNTISRIGDLISKDNLRHLYVMLIVTFYVLIIIITVIAIRKRWHGFILFLSVIIILSLPVLIAFSGLIASHFFAQADFCKNVYDAIYNGSFPVNDKRLGYYVSCFSISTRSTLYSLRWELDSYQNQLSQHYGNNSTSTPDELLVYTNVKNNIDSVRTNSLNKLIGCNHVYEEIVFAETNFCKLGMNWTYSLFIIISWLFLIVLLFSYSVNRMKPLVEKRKHEIDVRYL